MHIVHVNDEYVLLLLHIADIPYLVLYFVYIILPKTQKFGCVGRGDLTLLFFSKVVK